MDKYIVQLVRGQTYRSGNRLFKRGIPQEVEGKDYDRLLRQGNFADPRHDFYNIHPNQLPKYAQRNGEVVVIRDMGLGDVVIVSGSLRAVQKKFPSLRLRYAVKRQYLGMFKLFEIPTVSIEGLSGRQTVIDLRGYGERASDAWTADRMDVYAKYLAVYPLSDYLEEPRAVLRVHPEDMQASLELLFLRGYQAGKKTIGLCLRDSGVCGNIMEHPFMQRPWNRTMALDRQREFGGLALDRKYQVVLLDHEVMNDASGMWRADGIVDMTGQADLGRLGAVLSLCNVAVGPDTGQYHYAHAVGTPIVTYFGKIAPSLRVKNYDKCSAIWHPQRQSCPCGHSERCPDVACVAAVTPEELMAHVEKWIDFKRDKETKDIDRGRVEFHESVQGIEALPVMGRL